MKIKNYLFGAQAVVLSVFLLLTNMDVSAQGVRLPLGPCDTPKFVEDRTTLVPTSCGHSVNSSYIDAVVTTGGINNINNTSTGCGNTTNSYSDYTTTSMKVTQEAGKSVDVKVTWEHGLGEPGPGYPGFERTTTRIFVDWNNDGYFDDTGEVIQPYPTAGWANNSTGVHLGGASNAETIKVDVPAFAKHGLIRMRIITSAINVAGAWDYEPDSCYGLYGEAEDYAFDVINPCVPPASISKANINFKSAEISWSKRLTADFYEYIVTQVDTIPHDTVIGFTFTDQTSIKVDTLECETKYYVLVRSICDTINKGPSINWYRSEWTRDSFITEPCCYAPDVTLDSVKHNSMRASWPPIATAYGYEYAVSTLPTPPPKGNYTTSTTVLLQGLSPKTTYFFHVRSRCTPTPLSDWTHKADKTLGTTSVLDIDGVDPGMMVYPNPATDVITVELRTAIGNNAQLSVVDLTGKTVYNAPVTASKVQIDASSFATGVYIVQYTDDTHNDIMKVSKR